MIENKDESLCTSLLGRKVSTHTVSGRRILIICRVRNVDENINCRCISAIYERTYLVLPRALLRATACPATPVNAEATPWLSTTRVVEDNRHLSFARASAIIHSDEISSAEGFSDHRSFHAGERHGHCGELARPRDFFVNRGKRRGKREEEEEEEERTIFLTTPLAHKRHRASRIREFLKFRKSGIREERETICLRGAATVEEINCRARPGRSEMKKLASEGRKGGGYRREKEQTHGHSVKAAVFLRHGNIRVEPVGDFFFHHVTNHVPVPLLFPSWPIRRPREREREVPAYLPTCRARVVLTTSDRRAQFLSSGPSPSLSSELSSSCSSFFLLLFLLRIECIYIYANGRVVPRVPTLAVE